MSLKFQQIKEQLEQEYDVVRYFTPQYAGETVMKCTKRNAMAMLTAEDLFYTPGARKASSICQDLIDLADLTFGINTHCTSCLPLMPAPMKNPIQRVANFIDNHLGFFFTNGNKALKND